MLTVYVVFGTQNRRGENYYEPIPVGAYSSLVGAKTHPGAYDIMEMRVDSEGPETHHYLDYITKEWKTAQ